MFSTQTIFGRLTGASKKHQERTASEMHSSNEIPGNHFKVGLYIRNNET